MARKRPEKKPADVVARELPVSALYALEFPGRIAPGVEVIGVCSARRRVRALKLSRQLHLIPPQ
jgi:hypothetical protein